MIHHRIIPILTAAMLLATGCGRERLEETYISLDEGLAGNSFEEVQYIVNQEAANNSFAGLTNPDAWIHKSASSCPEVTFSAPLGSFPNTMTIDFGTGCTGYYGVERSGKIMSTFTGPYAEAGTTITTTTDAYYVNGHLIEGTRTVTNMGTNDAGNIWFTVVVSDGHVLLESGEHIYYEENREREWIEGAGGAPLFDDVYLITGSGSGINRMEVPYTTTITEPIRKELSCRWPVSGVKELVPEGYETRSVDFGDGSCDNIITVTIGGETFDIELPL